MEEKTFEELIGRTWDAMPARFKERVQNVALLTADEPSEELRREEGLTEGQTLLGLYHGIPAIERGETYGIGGTIPDTITLFRFPLIEAAEELMLAHSGLAFETALEEVVRETLWHEVGHYFGLSEHEIDEREHDQSNHF